MKGEKCIVSVSIFHGVFHENNRKMRKVYSRPYGCTISRHVKMGTLLASAVCFDVKCYHLAMHKSFFVQNVCILLTELMAILNRICMTISMLGLSMCLCRVSAS